MENYGMSQPELAIRTGASPEHIRAVITGKETITDAFAHALSSVFDIDASFWINLQAIYDKEMPQAGNGAYVRFVCAKA
jgi:plasmid maintenance system antidote protein VapI